MSKGESCNSNGINAKQNMSLNAGFELSPGYRKRNNEAEKIINNTISNSKKNLNTNNADFGEVEDNNDYDDCDIDDEVRDRRKAAKHRLECLLCGGKRVPYGRERINVRL